jgi:Zinc carboxypeptidase
MVVCLAPLVVLVAVVLLPLLSAPRGVDARALAADPPPAALGAQTAVTAEVFGQSAGGIPLTAYWVGSGATAVVVQGALHGGPEANTATLTYLLRDYLAAHPDEIPAGLRLAFIPEANPDGMAINRRLYLSGVDPNRNWDTPEWQTDAYDSDGRFVPGLGGPTPMSEPETRQFADWVLALRPAAVVQYHSRGGFIVGARELAEPYADASGYYLPTPGRGLGGLLPYRATGSLGRWLGEQGIGGILIELSNYTSPELERNLAGLRAVLRLVATRQATS